MNKKNIPNILTVARIAATLVFIAIYMSGHYLAAMIIFILASVTDIFDGKLARKYGVVSNFGKFVDPLADKILTYSAFCLLTYDRMIGAPVLIIVLFREFVVAGIRMLAACSGRAVAADVYGKIKTWLQMVAVPAMLFYMFLNEKFPESAFNSILYKASLVMIILSVLATVISGINYVVKNIDVLKD